MRVPLIITGLVIFFIGSFFLYFPLELGNVLPWPLRIIGFLLAILGLALPSKRRPQNKPLVQSCPTCGADLPDDATCPTCGKIK